MILFLRDKRNKSILDLEVISDTNAKIKDIHAVVCIEPYSGFLLRNLPRAQEIVKDFEELSELRGWYWEGQVYKDDSSTAVLELLRARLQAIARKYSLRYVED
jgi:hypothetical protein